MKNLIILFLAIIVLGLAYGSLKPADVKNQIDNGIKKAKDIDLEKGMDHIEKIKEWVEKTYREE